MESLFKKTDDKKTEMVLSLAKMIVDTLEEEGEDVNLEEEALKRSIKMARRRRLLLEEDC